jgi:tetratricopeptide (TPR) repeat protein
VCEPGCVDEREWILELLYRATPMSESTTSGRPGGCSPRRSTQPPRRTFRGRPHRRTLLGIVAHKADRLDEARAHLDAALPLALDAGDRTDEAYCRQELGFLLLDTGDPELALGEFQAVLALAPGAGIVNLAGNGLNGMGAALLQLGRAAEAVPFLVAALAIRAELEDLAQQCVDLAHLATAALALGDSSIAARIARFLDGHPDTAAGTYGHDRRTLRAVLDATSGVDADPTASFDEARRLTAGIGAASHPFIPRGRPGRP